MNTNLRIFSIVAVAFCLFLPPLSSQVPSVSFATWKDNRKAAYTIIHDDFSSYVPGIYKHAYSIAQQRGIKLCFGAITSACGPTEWTKAKTMIAKGHECVNHSHNHKCGGTEGQCTGLTSYGIDDFAVELDTSTNQIERNTGVRPRFFIHPYDAASEEVLDHLKNKLGYLGTRAGLQATNNSGNFSDFMRLNYHVFDGSAASLATLNTVVNSAIASEGYAIREFHGIADNSYGDMTVANYTSHLNFVKTKMNAGLIWSATTTEVITYKMQRDAFEPSAKYDKGKRITISFQQNAAIDPKILRTSVTLNVRLYGSRNLTYAIQNGVYLAGTIKGDTLSMNIFPHKGPIVVYGNIATPPPPPACVSDGKVVHQVWRNLTLNTYSLAALTTDARYPDAPTSVDSISALSSLDLGDEYGEKTFGYLVPKKTGAYTFNIAGDDDAEIYLSLTGNPADKVKICGFTGYTDIAEYEKYPEQKSATINLVAGKNYYIEVLHVGTVGASNHFHAYWTQPGTELPIIIDGSVLSTKNCDLINNPPKPAALQSAESFVFSGRLQGAKIDLAWASQSADEKDYFILEKADEMSGAFKTLALINANGVDKLQYFNYTDENLIDGDNIYRLKTTNFDGKIEVSDVVKIRYESPKSYVVFPNPASDHVEIDLSDAPQGKEVDIALITLLGKVVYQTKIEALGSKNHQIALDNLENGQYFVRIQAQGKKLVMKKLVVVK
jgi:hypothetical protein